VAAPVHRRLPEILAPAGDRDPLAAALAADADAVYFGLEDGFNARARRTSRRTRSPRSSPGSTASVRT
jgi:collagenase-like PrtC family protease